MKYVSYKKYLDSSSLKPILGHLWFFQYLSPKQSQRIPLSFSNRTLQIELLKQQLFISHSSRPLTPRSDYQCGWLLVRAGWLKVFLAVSSGGKGNKMGKKYLVPLLLTLVPSYSITMTSSNPIYFLKPWLQGYFGEQDFITRILGRPFNSQWHNLVLFNLLQPWGYTLFISALGRPA